MTENPWVRLPSAPPYVLPEDEPHIRAFNRKVSNKDHLVQVEQTIPEAFVGNKEAPIVLLSNNPGLSVFSNDDEYYSPAFMEQMRKNLLHEPAEYPFLFISPEHTSGVRGRHWWDQKLKKLLELFPRDVVARSVFNVTFFPYPSIKFGHRSIRVPSQEYSFSLVRRAVGRRAVIVLMRPGRERDWKKEVTELADYDRLIKVKNPQTPAISATNLADADFKMVVEAIRAAARA
jgi:hypothetical protein